MTAAASLPPPTRSQRLRRRLKTGAWVLLNLVLMVLLLLMWLTTTQTGLAFALSKIPAAFGISVKSKITQGSLSKGFESEDWEIEIPGSLITIKNLSLAWDRNALWKKRVHVRFLHIGQMNIQSTAYTPTEKKPPARLPETIRLPVRVDIDRIQVDGITSGDPKQPQPVMFAGRSAYHYADGRHEFRVDALNAPFGVITGTVAAQDGRPFPLNGRFDVVGEAEGKPLHGGLSIGGSLENPLLNGQLHGADSELVLDANLKPYAPLLNQKIQSLTLAGGFINPHAFIPTLPQANMSFSLLMRPSDSVPGALEGKAVMGNIAAQPADKNGIPFTRALGDFTINEQGVVEINALTARGLKNGLVALTGQIDTAHEEMALGAALHQLQAADVVSTALKGTLNGTVAVSGALDAPRAVWHLAAANLKSEGTLRLSNDRKARQQTLFLDNGSVSVAGGGALGLTGKLELYRDQNFEFALVSKALNPHQISTDYPVGAVNGSLVLTGTLAGKKPKLSGSLNLADSTLSQLPLTGKGIVDYQDNHLSRADTQITLGRNHLQTQGNFGASGDKLHLDIDAPNLEQFGFGLSGLLQAKGYLGGESKKPVLNLTGQARGFKVSNALTADELRFQLTASPELSQPVNIDLQGSNLKAGGTQINTVNLQVQGTGAAHTASAQTALLLDNKPYKLDLAARGGLDKQNQWKGTVSRLDLKGALNLILQNPVNVEAGSNRVSLSASRWSALGGSLNLQSFLWDKKTGLQSKGSAGGLQVEQLKAVLPIPLEQNLVLGADWDMNYSQNATGYFKVSRQSGDILLLYRNQKLALSKLEWLTRFENGRIANTLAADTQYGNINATLNLAQRFGNDISAAPIEGRIKADINDASKFKYFLPVGVDVAGELHADVAVGGRLNNPQFSGPLMGTHLKYRDYSSGIRLENGTLNSQLIGQKWQINALKFTDSQGDVTASGTVARTANAPADVDIDVVFNHYGILNQPERQLILSGKTNLLYAEKTGIALTGTLKVDKGLFDYPKEAPPALSEDVEVVGREKIEEEGAKTLIALNLALDLNNSFRFSGKGLDVLMGGVLNLTAKPGQEVQGIGTVKIIRGRYQAYGQNLVIKQGGITFSGSLNNPSLNLRAERYMSPVGAGVAVSGTVDNPRATLVANEPMSDKDKLSWLILGYAATGSDSDNAALATAAGALLAGNINQQTGLFDNIGLTSRQSRNPATGGMNPAEQMVTVGKNISRRFYVGYEYGIGTTDQAVKTIFRIGRGIQLILRVGTLSTSGEARYTIRFDHL